MQRALRALLALSVICGTASSYRGMHDGGEFCRAHSREIFTSFQMWMRIQRNVQTARNATQCALDVESPPEMVDVVAYANTAGIAVTVATANVGRVDVRTLQVLYSTNKSSMFVYLDTWSPWTKYIRPLYSNASADAHNETIDCLLEVLDLNKVHVDVGCAVEDIPVDVVDPIDYPRVYDPDLLRYVIPKNRKQNPGYVFVDLSVDSYCVHSVNVKTVLRDACIHHKNETPLNFYGRENFPLHKSPNSVIPTHKRGFSTCEMTTGQ
ncbi:GM-CSF/IL-2 inhibitory factor [Bovine papular stomatitis virus]